MAAATAKGDITVGPPRTSTTIVTSSTTAVSTSSTAAATSSAAAATGAVETKPHFAQLPNLVATNTALQAAQQSSNGIAVPTITTTSLKDTT